MKVTMKFLLAMVAVAAYALPSMAAVITPSSIAFTGTAGQLAPTPGNLVNSAGLSAPLAVDESNLATVTHGDATAGARWVTTDPGGSGSDWFDSSSGATVIFDIDLGGTFLLDKFVNWGYGFGSSNGNNISSVRFDFSTDGGGTIDSSQTVAVAEVFGVADIVALTPTTANFITMEVLDNHFNGPPASHGGDRVGLVEIRFTGAAVPEPSTLLLGLASLIGLVVVRRRK